MNKWNLFERLVTAIHLTENRGAKVVWNDRINGRQFDITIRFKHGFYEYLTVVECKSYSRPVPVREVEAFVTKSVDVRANKAIMVSSSGFQEGGIEVAERHNIELFTLEEINRLPEEDLSANLSPRLNISGVQLHTLKPPFIISLPEERNMLPFLIRTTIINSGDKTISLEELFSAKLSSITETANEKEKNWNLLLPPNCKVCSPVLDKEIELLGVSFRYRLVPTRIVRGSALDPFLIEKANILYEYSDVIRKNKVAIPSEKLELGFDTTLEEGKFYFNPHLEFSYYCDKIDSGEAEMYLVESYQHRMLIGCEFQMETKYAGQYLEVTDLTEIARLNKLLIGIKSCNK